MTIFLPSFFKLSDADYVPKRREISDVSVAQQPTVTTTEDHGYEVDQLVRLHVDKRYGMEIDGQIAKILTVPTTTTFTVDYDTSSLSAYVTPTYSNGNGFTQSHCVPITGTVDNQAT